MTDLQITLFGAGGVFIVGVFSYNKWQEYRQRKLAEALLKPHHQDVLLDEAEKKTAPVLRIYAGEVSESIPVGNNRQVSNICTRWRPDIGHYCM